MSTITLTQVRPAAVRAARPAPRPVRLTRRGRVVVLLLAAALLAAAWLALAPGSAATDAAPAPGGIDVITVAPGETLWDIAGDVAPSLGLDTGAAVERLQQMNDLSSGSLAAGQQLRVPAVD